MSEITDLTKAVKELVDQLKGTPSSRLTRAERKQETIDDLKERNKAIKKQQELLEKAGLAESKLAARRNKLQLEEIANREKLIELGDISEDNIKEKAADIAKLEKETEKYAKTTAKSTKVIKAQSKAFAKGAAEADNMLNGLLGLSGEGARFFQILGNGHTNLLGFAGGLLKSAFNGDIFLGIFKKIIGNSINFAFELDKQNAAFKAATGAGDEFFGVLADAGSEYLTYGMNAADAGRATQSLFGSFRDFTNLSVSEQTNIANTTMILEKFGASSAQTAQILDQATKSLYMNSQEAETLTRKAATLATAIGKPISEVAGDLASAAPKLAFYGKQMFDVFAQLERQSKSTGLSVDSLLGLVGEKFDTFKGAGEAVGRLNAILGGPYLNSIDMLNASEADRVEMIKEAIEAGGAQFDQLNKFEQKAFASAMGTDVDTLRRMLNNLDPEVQLQAMRQEELAKKAGDARDIMTKLTDAINSLIIRNEPLVNSIIKGVDSFSELIFQINAGKKSINDIIPSWVKYAFAISIAVKGFTIVSGLMSGIAGLKGTVIASNAAQALSFKKLGAAAATAAKGMTLAKGVGALGAGAVGAYGAYRTGQGAAAARKEGRYGAMLGNIGLGTGLGAVSGAVVGSLLFPGVGTVMGAKIGAGLGAGISGAGAAGLYDDATMPAPIQMAKFNNQDTFERVGNSVVAAKPDGTIDKAIREASERQTSVLVEAIQNSMNIKVQIGNKQLDDMVVSAMNSSAGRRSISPFYQGAGSLG